LQYLHVLPDDAATDRLEEEANAPSDPSEAKADDGMDLRFLFRHWRALRGDDEVPARAEGVVDPRRGWHQEAVGVGHPPAGGGKSSRATRLPGRCSSWNSTSTPSACRTTRARTSREARLRNQPACT